MKGELTYKTLGMLKSISTKQSNSPAIFNYYRISFDLFLDTGYTQEQPLDCIAYFMQSETPLTGSLIC